VYVREIGDACDIYGKEPPPPRPWREVRAFAVHRVLQMR
jgi:hypothetical protein